MGEWVAHPEGLHVRRRTRPAHQGVGRLLRRRRGLPRDAPALRRLGHATSRTSSTSAAPAPTTRSPRCSSTRSTICGCVTRSRRRAARPRSSPRSCPSPACKQLERLPQLSNAAFPHGPERADPHSQRRSGRCTLHWHRVRHGVLRAAAGRGSPRTALHHAEQLHGDAGNLREPGPAPPAGPRPVAPRTTHCVAATGRGAYMGWTVLYIAFGVVALWLLGEVLLQYKARLRWRLLAFAGFLGVVLGVLIPVGARSSALGAIAFAIGQTYVTLSFRRGFSAGWAVRAGVRGEGEERRQPPRRRRGRRSAGAREPDAPGPDPRRSSDRTPRACRNVPAGRRPARRRPATTCSPPAVRARRRPGRRRLRAAAPARRHRQYGVYSDAAYAARRRTSPTRRGQDQLRDAPGRRPVRRLRRLRPAAVRLRRRTSSSTPPTPTRTSARRRTARTARTTAGYDQQQYGQQGYGQDQYGSGYDGETPPGGVWVPQQRSTDDRARSAATSRRSSSTRTRTTATAGQRQRQGSRPERVRRAAVPLLNAVVRGRPGAAAHALTASRGSPRPPRSVRPPARPTSRRAAARRRGATSRPTRYSPGTPGAVGRVQQPAAGRRERRRRHRAAVRAGRPPRCRPGCAPRCHSTRSRRSGYGALGGVDQPLRVARQGLRSVQSRRRCGGDRRGQRDRLVLGVRAECRIVRPQHRHGGPLGRAARAPNSRSGSRRGPACAPPSGAPCPPAGPAQRQQHGETGPATALPGRDRRPRGARHVPRSPSAQPPRGRPRRPRGRPRPPRRRPAPRPAARPSFSTTARDLRAEDELDLPGQAPLVHRARQLPHAARARTSCRRSAPCTAARPRSPGACRGSRPYARA